MQDPRELLPSNQREQWTGDDHQAEAILYLAREGVDASVIQAMNAYAVGRLAAYVGEKLPDHEVDSFLSRFKGKVSEPTLAKLVKWFREIES